MKQIQMNKIIPVFLVVLALSASPVLAAYVSGNGDFWARGMGQAEMTGIGTIESRGNGIVRVFGTDDIVADGFGSHTFEEGWHEYRGRGTITINSGNESMIVQIRGRTEIHATGEGEITFEGRGFWRTSN